MRRIAIGAALLCAGCEELEVGPELVPWVRAYEVEVPTEVSTEEPLELFLFTAFDFVDPDGDVVEAGLVHTDPEGTEVVYQGCRIPRGNVQPACIATIADPTARNFDNVTLATMYVDFAVPQPWLLGEHLIEAWVVDREGFESNHVTTVATLVAPSE
jgi:hypothetical protein